MQRLSKVLAGAAVVFLARWAWAADAPVFYPPLPDAPRIQFLKSYSTRKDIAQSENWFARFVFGPEKEGSIVGKPYGIAVRGPRVYVCDTGKDVRVMNLETRELSWMGGSGRVQLKKPINITIDSKGNKFVADAGLAKVVVFDADDKFVRSYQDPAGWKPIDVAVADAEIYVLDVDNNTVKVLDRGSGKVLRSLGSTGSDEGKFFKPTNLALDANGNLYVSDTMNFRIQKFDRKGAYLKSYGELGRAPGTFSRPKGIAIDPHSYIYAVDAAFDNVQIFDGEGGAILFFGGTGNEPGQMYLPAKVTLDFDPGNLARFQALADPRLKLQYLIWVTNQYGPNRINVYGFGEWQEAKVVP